MNADLFLTLLFLGCGCAWMLTGVNPIRLSVELLTIIERVLHTACDCCRDFPETFADRWNSPARRQQVERASEMEERG